MNPENRNSIVYSIVYSGNSRQFINTVGDTFDNAEGICQEIGGELFTLNELLPTTDCAESLIGFQPLSVTNADTQVLKKKIGN